MNFYQNSLIWYAYEKVSVASQILRDRGVFRDGIPDAWVSSLMRLKKEVHVPAAVHDEFDFLSHEMGCCLEACQGGRLQFLDDVDHERVRSIECAYWKVHAAITQWLIRSFSELLYKASPADASYLLEVVNTALQDAAFWDVGEHAVTFRFQPFDEWQPSGKPN